ncbi:MAG: hypothetical protein IT381_21335 [Deltaproteobacteria bacterium]|nr:hypothetical protein [Deltaproteobacteria bacterium]
MRRLAKMAAVAVATWTLAACPPPPATTAKDPLKRVYSADEFTDPGGAAGVAGGAGIGRTCPLERRRGGVVLTNNGETLVIVNCIGLVTTYDAAGDVAKMGQLDLLNTADTALKQGSAAGTARGFVQTPDVKRVDNLGASSVVVFHQAGYDVVDVSDPAAPRVTASKLIIRSEATSAIRVLNRVAIAGKTGEDDYTLQEGRLLSPWAIDGGCVLLDQFAVVTLNGYQTAERDSVLTGLITPEDPLSLGGALAYDIATGGLATQLAASMFAPRSCEANDAGLVMFSDEEDSGIYPYSVEIFAQLGFREYFGAVFKRVGEVFGSAVEIGGAALGEVIVTLTPTAEGVGLAAGPPAGGMGVVAALQQRITAVGASGLTGDLGALWVRDQFRAIINACPNGELSVAGKDAAAEAAAGCARTQLAPIVVTDPSLLAEDLATRAGVAGATCAGSVANFQALGACASLGGAGFVTAAAGILGNLMIATVFDPVFKLHVTQTVSTIKATASSAGSSARGEAEGALSTGCKNSVDVVDVPARTAFLDAVSSCVQTQFTNFSAATFEEATAKLSPMLSTNTPCAAVGGGQVGATLCAIAGCAGVAYGTFASTPGLTAACNAENATNLVNGALLGAGGGGLLAIYTVFGTGVGTAAGTAAGAALFAVPTPPNVAAADLLVAGAVTAGVIAGSVTGASGPTENDQYQVSNAAVLAAIAGAAGAGAQGISGVREPLVQSGGAVFTSLATTEEVWGAGPLRTVTWDELGTSSRYEADAMNYSAFRAMPVTGDRFLNRYTFDLVNPRRGAKYVKVYGTRFDGTTTADDDSLRGLRALSYLMASSECFDLNKQWNAPRTLADGPMRSAVKPDVPALLNPMNLQTGGTVTDDLENPDAILPLYTFNASNAWVTGSITTPKTGYMGAISTLHKKAWDTWVDRDATIAAADKAAVKALVSGAPPQLNEAIDAAFQCADPADFSNPNFTCMLCQARFSDLLSLKLENRPQTDPNAKVSCTIKYKDAANVEKRVTSTPSCAGRMPGSKPRPAEFTAAPPPTTLNGEPLTIDGANSKLMVKPAGSAEIVAEWDCTCEGEVATLQCDANGNVNCLANIDFTVNVKTPAEDPTTYAEVSAYNTVLNQVSIGPFGKMHLVDLSGLAAGMSIGAPTKAPTFDELTPPATPSQWNIASRLVRKGRAIASAANPVRVDDQFGTDSSQLKIHTRLFTNGVDAMAKMPGTRHFLAIEGPEGWDFLDTKDYNPNCEAETNPEFKSSCFHNAMHFGFAIVPTAKSFLNGVLPEDQVGALTSNLYLFDQDPLPTLADPFIGVNGATAVGIDERTILLTEGGSNGGRVWIYDVQSLADGTGEPVEVYKEALAPGFFLGGVAADANSGRVFIIGFRRDETSTAEELKIFRIGGDVPFVK